MFLRQYFDTGRLTRRWKLAGKGYESTLLRLAGLSTSQDTVTPYTQKQGSISVNKREFNFSYYVLFVLFLISWSKLEIAVARRGCAICFGRNLRASAIFWLVARWQQTHSDSKFLKKIGRIMCIPGNLTTGPFMVPNAVSAILEPTKWPCLKLVPQNLYWPTS